jgi:hypothetical protein
LILDKYLSKETIINIRIVVLMLLVAVAVYHTTAQDICRDIENTKLTNKDKFGFFYSCVYLNETEMQIIENSKIQAINYNLTEKFK